MTPPSGPSVRDVVGPVSFAAGADKKPNRMTRSEVEQVLCAPKRRAAAPAAWLVPRDRCGLRLDDFLGGREEIHGSRLANGSEVAVM